VRAFASAASSAHDEALSSAITAAMMGSRETWLSLFDVIELHFLLHRFVSMPLREIRAGRAPRHRHALEPIDVGWAIQDRCHPF
jgi:hypothetical protein